jgi:hypothetical protein
MRMHAADVLDDAGLDAFGGLVQHQQARAGGQRAADGQLLLLAAGQVATAAADHLLEHGEQLEDLRRDGRATGARGQAHAQVVFHRQAAEDLAALRHVADAGAHAFVGRGLGDVGAAQHHAPGLHRHHAHQALQQRGLAHAVAAQHHGDLAHARLEAHVAQDVAAAVVLVQAFDLQQLLHRPR